MSRYRLDLAYDGSEFRGWARNRGVRSVQGEIEAALAVVLGSGVTLTVAGRTDAGVHARHQVATFDHDGSLRVGSVLKSLRTMLGPEISVRSLKSVPDEFDARHSARRRRYRYFIDEAAAPDPLRRVSVWHVGERLSMGDMNSAATHFVGSHDFASLCRAPKQGTTDRTVESAAWRRGGRALIFDVAGRAFCHQMVRSMVALCVDVGRGKLDAGAVPEIIAARDRNAARGVAPPHGLVLWEVEY